MKLKSHTADVLDAKKIRNLRELNEAGKPDFVTELATIFLTETPPLLENLEHAVRTNDGETTKRLAHKWKGMSFNIGANTLAQVLQKLEDHGRNQEMEPCAALLLACKEELSRVIEALAQVTKQAA